MPGVMKIYLRVQPWNWGWETQEWRVAVLRQCITW